MRGKVQCNKNGIPILDAGESKPHPIPKCYPGRHRWENTGTTVEEIGFDQTAEVEHARCVLCGTTDSVVRVIR